MVSVVKGLVILVMLVVAVVAFSRSRVSVVKGLVILVMRREAKHAPAVEEFQLLRGWLYW